MDGSRLPVEDPDFSLETGFSTVMFEVHPPEDCAEGAVDVLVRRRSDDAEAVVEFSLDPDAEGPGCFTA